MIHPYATEAYAQSLSHWGQALRVPEWGCDVLLRLIDADARDAAAGIDAAGTYPIAVLGVDADLGAGLERLRQHGVVSVTLVLDDFHRPPLAELRRHFAAVRPFKTHYIRRAALPFEYARHHRYEVRRGHGKVAVNRFELRQRLPEWVALYANLTRRHDLGGVHDFPVGHFQALQQLDGVTSIGAWIDDRLVAAHLWVDDGRRVHSHLAASSGEGYSSGAAYAVYDASVRHFDGAELVNFGGGAGLGDATADGLARFKSGFANDTAPAYVCGAILDAARYDELTRHKRAAPDTLFFPAYRARTV